MFPALGSPVHKLGHSDADQCSKSYTRQKLPFLGSPVDQHGHVALDQLVKLNVQNLSFSQSEEGQDEEFESQIQSDVSSDFDFQYDIQAVPALGSSSERHQHYDIDVSLVIEQHGSEINIEPRSQSINGFLPSSDLAPNSVPQIALVLLYEGELILIRIRYYTFIDMIFQQQMNISFQIIMLCYRQKKQ
ncbi:MAG: hypothetical protein EZS28_005212 [Streblomastix strix]|uniref:Uncharacterized protein n=1 Tax=Streblomastix strix TaxID=222440 RepID=A0A5J4WWE5_9EUKA|nr:MAG: hypothetical protein EZS28_005212 [Streblomastix strix]